MRIESDGDRDDVRHLLGVVLSDPESIPKLSSAELDLAIRLARRVRLLGRLAVSLDRAKLLASLPPTAIDHLRSAAVMAESRARLALWELDRIAWAMGADSATPLLVMKGCAYLLLDLPNAPGRLFADVDLLTSERALEDVEAKLNARGWRSQDLTPYDQNYYRRWTHELPPLTHEDREVEIDLHHNILPRTARLKPRSEKLLECAQQISDSRYGTLAKEDIVLHAMVHLMFDSDLADKLRDLVDIGDLLAHFSREDPDFWQNLIDRATELDLHRPAFYSVRYANELLGLHVPESVIEQIQSWGPPGPVLRLMDCLVPMALYPPHPDRRSRLRAFCRLCLFVRSHWIRMPPWLLIYHLTYKFALTRFTARQPVH